MKSIVLFQVTIVLNRIFLAFSILLSFSTGKSKIDLRKYSNCYWENSSISALRFNDVFNKIIAIFFIS